MTPLSSIPAATQARRLVPRWPSKFEHLNLFLLSHVCPITYRLLAVVVWWGRLPSGDPAVVFATRKNITDKPWYTSRENVSA